MKSKQKDIEKGVGRYDIQDVHSEDGGQQQPQTCIDEYDKEAIDSIKKSDIVIYIGNLSIVPDDSHKDEIDVILIHDPNCFVCSIIDIILRLCAKSCIPFSFDLPSGVHIKIKGFLDFIGN